MHKARFLRCICSVGVWHALGWDEGQWSAYVSAPSGRIRQCLLCLGALFNSIRISLHERDLMTGNIVFTYKLHIWQVGGSFRLQDTQNSLA